MNKVSSARLRDSARLGPRASQLTENKELSLARDLPGENAFSRSRKLFVTNECETARFCPLKGGEQPPRFGAEGSPPPGHLGRHLARNREQMARGPWRTTEHGIESIDSALPRALLGLERLIFQGAKKGPRREAAPQDMAGDEESFALDAVIRGSHRALKVTVNGRAAPGIAVPGS